MCAIAPTRAQDEIRKAYLEQRQWNPKITHEQKNQEEYLGIRNAFSL
jgi:hypothetical protein